MKEKIKNNNNKVLSVVKATIPYILAVLLCAGVAIPMFSDNLILDEAFSVCLVRGNVRDIITGTAADVHPPLYYLILKAASVLTGQDTIHFYRMISILGTWANLLILGATVIRRNWGNRVAIFYLLWFGTAYSTFDYSNKIRMYSWGCFFVTATALSMYKYYQSDKKRNLIMTILLTLAAMYTHYYGVMAVFFMWVILLVASLKKKRKILWILGSGVAITLGYLPWLLVWWQQSNDFTVGYWTFRWGEWWRTPYWLINTEEPALAAMLCMVLIAALIYALIHRNWTALIFGSVFVLTMLCGAVISLLYTSIWAERYLYVTWGTLSLMVALAIGDMKLEKTFPSQILFILILCYGGCMDIIHIRSSEVMSPGASELLNTGMTVMDENAWILADNPIEHVMVFQCYMPGRNIMMTQEPDTEKLVSDFLEKAEGQEKWFAYDRILLQHDGDKIKEEFEKKGYLLAPTGEYNISYKYIELFRIEEAEK